MISALAMIALALFPFWASAAQRDVKILEPTRSGGRLEFNVVTPGGPLLTSDDFNVTVNDLPVEDVVVSPLSASVEPPGAAIVVDTSGSMVGRPIAEAKEAVASFVDAVDASSNLALVAFSSTSEVLVPPTSEHQRIVRTARRLDASGETALYDAIVLASRLVRPLPPEQKNVVLLSDGADTVSKASLADAIRAAKASKVNLFLVALESPDFSASAVRGLTDKTGGRLIRARAAAELSQIFEGLAQTLASRYEVSVRDPDATAELVEIAVEVTQEDAVVRGSETFRLPLPDAGDTRPGLPGLLDIPLPVLLLITFVSIGAAVFFATELVGSRRSPADRVAWYATPAGDEIDTDELINAQVLRRAKEVATDLAERGGHLQRIEREVDAAGLRWRAGEVIVGSIGLGLAAFVFILALDNWVSAVLVGIAALFAPAGYIRYQASRRRKRFYGQLADVLMLMGGALRAGYSLQQALAAVGEDAKPPASEEFRRAMAEVRLGGSLDDALRDLSARIGIVDFEWTVLAIQIQREVGGNLAEILEIISDTIRERERLRGQIKALTAEGRISGLVLGIMPFFMAGLLLLQSPDYLRPLYETTLGLMMLGVSGFMMIVGALWMRKIVRIEV